ncbi:hypothetical protein [Curtobacterium sp. MCBD17_040]|uniref:hypothetical protein n=1 Tax=Curtobacterium sp. MCBD17_040 TaxID=2175674 RepID=UPI0011B3F5F3|nr:hypothetical protein [Curtobacterium sp. MCBD17_040]WIB65294.1 hypothetical protein DEI94_17975 [Curtobacterium sp. MCBD17_040]
MPLLPLDAKDSPEDVVRLRMYLDLCEELERDHERLAGVRPRVGSRLDVDNERSHPLQNGHLAAFCQLMAIDNLRAFRLLTRRTSDDNVELPLFAGYPLLRSVIESASQTIWLLEPEDRKERLTRNFRARMSEHQHDVELAKSVFTAKPAETPADRLERVAAQEADKKAAQRRVKMIDAAAGNNAITREQYNQPMPGYRSLAYQAGVFSGLDAGVVKTVWLWVSGLTHPSAARALNSTDFLKRSSTRRGEMHGLMTSKTGMLVATLSVALTTYKDADRLLRTAMLTVDDR